MTKFNLGPFVQTLSNIFLSPSQKYRRHKLVPSFNKTLSHFGPCELFIGFIIYFCKLNCLDNSSVGGSAY